LLYHFIQNNTRDYHNRTARTGARVIFRNLMTPRKVPETSTGKIVKDELLSKQIYVNDRSFVYGKVAAYDISE